MIQKKLFWLRFVLPFVVSLVSAQQRRPDLNPSTVGHLPLIFEPNVGQGPAGFAFVARGVSSIFLQPDRAVLVLPDSHDLSASQSAKAASTLVLQLMHCNDAARAEGLNLLPGKSNYYIGADQKSWRTGIPQYSAVAFKSVYPGVDIVYYGQDGVLEYDLVLSPVLTQLQ